MRAIKVKNKAVLIPDSWEDLNFGEKIFTFKTLIRVLHGDLKDTPHIGLLKLLIHYTEYRPKSFRFYRLKSMVKYLWKSFLIYLINIPFLFAHGRRQYRAYTRLLRSAQRPDPNKEELEREIIDLGLLRLAESIDFVYKIDTEARKIIPLYTFRTNPFTYIRLGKSKYTGKRFFFDLTSHTDITARCFVDALDHLLLMENVKSREHKEECINKICAILYPAVSDHNENLLSGHARRMRDLNPVVKFGIVYWFTGIVNCFRENDTYRVLFDRIKKAEDEGKITIGMNEIALFLKKEGYGDPNNMNLIDYFDAQVKALKDNISKAIAEGVKPADISDHTGIPLDTIHRLK